MKTEPHKSAKGGHADKYLTVSLANEAYGIAVVKVREIIRFTAVTHLPHMPAFVKGVINLRGRVVPVIDLRLKFGFADNIAERTCIVVVEVTKDDGRLVPMGLVVDSVDDVASVAQNEVEPTPHLGVSMDTSYLVGMAKVKGQVKLLLDIDRVVGLRTLEAAAAA